MLCKLQTQIRARWNYPINFQIEVAFLSVIFYKNDLKYNNTLGIVWPKPMIIQNKILPSRSDGPIPELSFGWPTCLPTASRRNKFYLRQPWPMTKHIFHGSPGLTMISLLSHGWIGFRYFSQIAKQIILLIRSLKQKKKDRHQYLRIKIKNIRIKFWNVFNDRLMGR